MFSLTNYARHCGLNIDTIMRKSNDKFEKRFNYIEDNCNIKDSDLKVMQKLWEKSK